MLIRLSCYNKFLLLCYLFLYQPIKHFPYPGGQSSVCVCVCVCERAHAYVVLLATQKFHFKVCR